MKILFLGLIISLSAVMGLRADADRDKHDHDHDKQPSGHPAIYRPPQTYIPPPQPKPPVPLPAPISKPQSSPQSFTQPDHPTFSSQPREPVPHPAPPSTSLPRNESSPSFAPQSAPTSRQSSVRPKTQEVFKKAGFLRDNKAALMNAARTPSMSNVDRINSARSSSMSNVDRASSHTHVDRTIIDQLSIKKKQAKQQLASQLSPSQKEKVKSTIRQQKQSAKEAVDHVREHVKKSYPTSNQWFNDQFYNRHQMTSNFDHHRASHVVVNWWLINNWLDLGWNYPLYYGDQGYPVELTPEDLNVQPPVYAAPQSDWIELGIFAAGTTVAETAYSNLFVQLALNREGVIAGTYYNAATDKIFGLEGSVDRETQQAMWTISSNPNSPVMTAGVFNLTQDVVAVDVHFVNDVVQNWVLVKIER